MKEQPRVKFPSQLTQKRYLLHSVWTVAVVLTYSTAFLLTTSSSWLLIAIGSFVCFLCTIHGFSIAHECSHQNWFREKRINHLLGAIMLLPTAIPYSSFKYQHLLHHYRTNDLDYDDAWRPIPRRGLWVNVLLLRLDCFIRCYCQFLGPLLQTFLRDYPLRGIPDGGRRKYLPSIAASVGFLGAMLGIFLLNPVAFIFGFLIPLIAFHQVLALLGLLHHGAISDPSPRAWSRGVKNSVEHQFSVSKDTVFPKIIEVLCCFQNYHVSHHLSPRIPFYYNKAAHNHLMANHRGGLYVQSFRLKLLAEHARMNRIELERKLTDTSVESNT